jgi:hypothetical protein
VPVRHHRSGIVVDLIRDCPGSGPTRSQREQSPRNGPRERATGTSPVNAGPLTAGDSGIEQVPCRVNRWGAVLVDYVLGRRGPARRRPGCRTRVVADCPSARIAISSAHTRLDHLYRRPVDGVVGRAGKRIGQAAFTRPGRWDQGRTILPLTNEDDRTKIIRAPPWCTRTPQPGATVNNGERCRSAFPGDSAAVTEFAGPQHHGLAGSTPPCPP